MIEIIILTIYFIGLGIGCALADNQKEKDKQVGTLIIAAFWPIILICSPLLVTMWLSYKITQRCLSKKK